MAIYCLLGVLAAFGALSLGWAAFGWLLPAWRSSVLICLCEPGLDPAWTALCYSWLHGLGLIKAPLLLVNSTLPPDAQEKLRQRHPGHRILHFGGASLQTGTGAEPN